VKYLKEAVRELHDFFEPYAVLGLAYAELYQRADVNAKKEFSELAIRNLEEAVARRDKAPSDSELLKIYMTLGWLRIKSLDFGRAEDAFRKTADLHIKNSETVSDDVLNFLGISQFQCKKYEEALATFQRCQDREKPILRFNIGRCLEELNKFSEAKVIYKTLHEEYPKFAEPLLRLAALAVRDTRPHIINVEAKEYLEAIVQEIDPNNVHAWLELANVNARSGQLREADTIMQKTQELAAGKDGFLYATVSSGNYSLQSAQNKTVEEERRVRISKAQKAYHRALRENQSCVSAANGIAICWLLTGHVSEAKDQLSLVKEYRPELSASWQNLGLAYMRESSYQAAQSLFEDANKRFFDKTDPNLLSHYYSACKGDKRFENCLSVAQQLCQLRPEYDIHWYMLASSLHKVVLSRSSPRSVQEKKLRVTAVTRWIRQAQRAISVFKFFAGTPAGIPSTNGINEKIKMIEEQCLGRLRKLLTAAEQNEAKRKEEFQAEVENLISDTDPEMDGRPTFS
jgi:tetratricopeptide (TPR) repeat protein